MRDVSHVNDLGAADLRKRLRLVRERVRLTQAQAANEIEVARTTLVAIESGKRPLRIEELRRLAESGAHCPAVRGALHGC